MPKWYARKSSGGQGLVIDEETGRHVAVTYDEKDAPVVAAARDMLEALRACEPLIHAPCLARDLLRAAIAKAEEEVH